MSVRRAFSVWQSKTQRLRHARQLYGYPTGNNEILREGHIMVIQHPQAELTFDEVIKAWFVHAGRAYPVESVPAAIFNAAVLDLVPNWRMSPIYGEVSGFAETV
jgi:hypothetical protein